MAYIGRLINVGLSKESTRGTAAAAWLFVAKTDFSFKEMAETIADESSIGTIVDSRDVKVIKKSWSGDLSGVVSINEFGYALLSTLGSVTTSPASTGAYEHTFELNESNAIQSLTISINDPVEWDKAYPLACLDSLTINAEEGAYLTYTATFMSKPWESATHTVTYAADYQLLARNSVFKVAANAAWLDAASGVCIKSFEITFTKNLEADYCVWSITPRDFINKQFSVEGSFTAVYAATTYKDYQLAGTKRAIRFEVVDSNTTIGATDNPTLSIDLPLVAFTEWDKTQGNNEVVIETLTFKGLYSIADGAVVTATLVNTKATY